MEVSDYEHPLSGLFTTFYNTTAIYEYAAVAILLLKDCVAELSVYLKVRVREAIGEVLCRCSAGVGGVLYAHGNLYYLYGILATTVVSLAISLYWLVFLAPTKEQKLLYQLKACYKELHTMVDKTNCHPLLLRLAWSDAVTYDCMVEDWPYCGGVNGSIRFDFSLDHPSNAGLSKAISYLQPFHYRYPAISWADLIQMAGVVSIEACGGPTIPLIYGRLDAPMRLVDSQVTTEDLMLKAVNTRQRQLACSFATSHVRNIEFPSAVPPFPDGAPSADVHLRNVFYRLGLNNRETVALCGAHTIGRAFADRSGVCPHSTGDQGASLYTKSSAVARFDGRTGVGMPGGCSWTAHWLSFDNEYYKRVVQAMDQREKDHRPPIGHGSCPFTEEPLLWLPIDAALYECPEYRPYFLRYAYSLDDFRRDYCAAHIKMSELGAKFKCKLKLEID